MGRRALLWRGNFCWQSCAVAQSFLALLSPVQDGDKFWRMPECYIRGSTIKYLRIPDEIIDMVKEEVVSKGRGRGGMQQQKQQKGRGIGGTGRGSASVLGGAQFLRRALCFGAGLAAALLEQACDMRRKVSCCFRCLQESGPAGVAGQTYASHLNAPLHVLQTCFGGTEA